MVKVHILNVHAMDTQIFVLKKNTENYVMNMTDKALY